MISPVSAWERAAFGWLRETLEGTSAHGQSLSIDVAGTAIEASVAGARETDHGLAEQVKVQMLVRLDGAAAPQEPYRALAQAALPSRPRLTLRPRTRADDTGVSLGLNRPFKTSDGTFDSAVWVASDQDPETLSEILAIPEVRSTAVDLVRLGAERLRINEGDTNLVVDVWFRTRDPEAREKLRQSLAGVARLSKTLPRFTGEPARASTLSAIMEYAFLPLPLAGIVTSMSAYEWRAPLDVSPILMMLGTGLTLWLVSVPLAFVTARGRHNGFLLFKSTALPLLIGLPGLAVALGILVNGAWDEQRSSHHVEVVQKVSGDDDVLRVRDYRSPMAGMLALEVERELWDVVEPGDRVVLTVSEGRLGWRWLVEVRAEGRTSRNQRVR
jgi:hypothetical protein